MKYKIFVGLPYYLIALLSMTIGISLMYVGTQIYVHANIVTTGIWMLAIGILVFFGRNAYFMMEPSDPAEMVF